jgi:aminoglycoside 3-N-acetyltransferase
MSVIEKCYRSLALISPKVEVLFRHIYWRNFRYLKKFKPYAGYSVKNIPSSYVNFDVIIAYLKEMGVKRDSLLVIHSSYDVLSSTGLKPQEIICRLRELVGKNGTIALPAIRLYKEEPSPESLLNTNMNEIVCEYNIMRTPLQSGLLPFTVLRMKDSVCSHFPLNPLVAIGPLAKEMMEHNIDNEKCSAHGKESCWKYCLDHDAFIIGLGVDLEHHNTMAHVMEEAYDGWHWSDNEWYQNRTFDIIDEYNHKKRIIVRERKPKWGMLHIAELNMVHQLYKFGIIRKKKFGNIPVCVERAQDLREFLQARNGNGFPYFQ